LLVVRSFVLEWRVVATTQASKALSKESSGENHKRTWQGVSAKLESYLYKTCLVCATNN